MILIFYVLLGIIGICPFIKLYYLSQSERKGMMRYFKSYFKRYSQMKIYDATASGSRRFMQASNIIKGIWWPALIITGILAYKLFIKA